MNPNALIASNVSIVSPSSCSKEGNYLINPAHSDYRLIEIEGPIDHRCGRAIDITTDSARNDRPRSCVSNDLQSSKGLGIP